eukprot:Skav234067  [mRNA]  locus=scaffold2565:1195:1695:+ [translate_table: standard]
MARPWRVKTVVAVEGPHLKKDWTPQVKSVEGGTFFKVSKFDRSLVMALTGRGLDLRSNKAPHVLNGAAFDQILALRNTSCNQVYQQTMKDAAVAAGEEWKPSKSGMCAKDDHRFICGQTVTVSLPAVQSSENQTVGPLQVGFHVHVMGQMKFVGWCSTIQDQSLVI